MTDRSLKRCAAGHEKEQRMLYEQFAPQLYAVCIRYAPDRSMAQDMLQEGFINIFQGLKSYQGKGSLGAWLHRVMINSILEYLRKEKRQGPVIDLDQVSQASEEVSSLDQLVLDDLLAVMQDLPEGTREVVNLYIVDGYSHKEIADMLEISVDNSKQRLRRGRLLLQEALHKTYVRKHEQTAKG